VADDRTPLDQLEDPKPEDVGAWVRCCVTGVHGQVWSYGKTKRHRIIDDGKRYNECMVEHLVPIEPRVDEVQDSATPEPEQDVLW
jgi:hypothetical protein